MTGNHETIPKRTNSKLAILLIALVAVLYLGNLFIDNPYTHRLVNFYLNEKVITKLPIKVEYQSIKVQLLPPSITLFSLDITELDPVTKTPTENILNANQISLAVSPWSLFLAKPQIGDLDIHDLHLKWPLSQPLTSALKALEPKERNVSDDAPPTWPPAPSPPLSSIRLRNAAIQILVEGLDITSAQNPNEATYILADGIDFFADFNGWRDIFVETKIQHLDLSTRSTSILEGANFAIEGSLRGDRFDSQDFELSSPRVKTQGSASVQFKTASSRKILESIEINLKNNTNADASLLGSFLDLSGTFGNFSAHTNTNIVIPVAAKQDLALKVTGHAISQGATIYGFHLYNSESDLEITPKGIEFTNTQIKSGNESYGTAKGTLQFNRELNYNFKLNAEKLPFDTLLGIFNVPFDVLNFKMSSKELSIIGEGDPFKMRVSGLSDLTDFSTPAVDYAHDKIPTPPACRLNLMLNINSRGIEYDQSKGFCARDLSSDLVDFPLEIKGFTSFNEKSGMNLSFQAPQNFNPAWLSYFAQVPLSGVGSLNINVRGPYSKVGVDVSTNISQFKLGQADLDSFKAIFNIKDGIFSWNDLVLTTPYEGQMTSEYGQISLATGLHSKAKFQLTNIDHVTSMALINSFAPSANGLELVINHSTISTDAPLLNPFLGELQVQVDAESVRDTDQEYASKIIGSLKVNNKGLQTEGLQVNIGTLSTSSTGGIFLDKPLEGFSQEMKLPNSSKIKIDTNILHSDSTNDQLARLPFLGKIFKDANLTGRISGSSKLTGRLDKVSGVSKLEVDNLAFNGIRLPSLRTTIMSSGLAQEIIADIGGNALKIRLEVDPSKEKIPYKWYLSAKNFDARFLLGETFASDPRNFFYFTGSSAMEGHFSDWWTSTGEIDIQKIKGKFFPTSRMIKNPIQWENSRPAQIRLEKNQWTFNENKILQVNSDLGAIGIGFENMSPPNKLGIMTSGRLNLESLKKIRPDLEVATGSVSFRGGIFGTVSNPTTDINLYSTKITAETASTWQPLSLGFADFRPPIKDIDFKARLQNQVLTLESLDAVKGSGKISASGSLNLGSTSNEVSSDLRIKLTDATFLYPFPIIKNFDSQISGEFSISGRELPFTAAGNLYIKRARSTRDIDLREAILESLRSSAQKSGPESLKPSIKFDLNIEGQESISFNTRAIQAVLSSKLRLGGDDVNPEVIGLIEINKGKFFYKRDFIVQRGLINFDDPIKPDPTLDISAMSEVSGYRVTILINGKASDPAVDFSIDPSTRSDGSAISKLDIITLLSRGSLPDAGALGRTNAESTAAAEALNLLAGQVEDTVQKVFELSGQTIIRQVYIDTYADSTGKPIARFNLPLNITEDLDVILKVDQSNVNLSSEYALHDSISVAGGIETSNEKSNTGVKRQRTPADTGVDLKFRFAFP